MQKIHSSTQKFTEVVDFTDNVVILQDGNACMIIEITANNFALLSQREQDTKIFSYAAFLNSLSFPIQILVRNKRMDISSYLKTLDDVEKTIKIPQLINHIKLYRSFVHEMVTVNVVLNKSFYIIIRYSPLETGVSGVAHASQKGISQVEANTQAAKKSLRSKADSILIQLQKFAMSAKILEKEDLISLFYIIYNEETELHVEQIVNGINASFISGNKP